MWGKVREIFGQLWWYTRTLTTAKGKQKRHPISWPLSLLLLKAMGWLTLLSFFINTQSDPAGLHVTTPTTGPVALNKWPDKLQCVKIKSFFVVLCRNKTTLSIWWLLLQFIIIESLFLPFLTCRGAVGFVKVVLLVDKSIMTFLFLVLVIIFP